MKDKYELSAGIRASMAVICCPIVALLRKSGNTSSSFSLCKPTTNRSFIKMLFDPGQSKKVRVKKENCFQNLQSQEMTTLFLCFCTLKILTPAEEIVEGYLGLNCNFLSKISWRKLVKALISCEDYQTGVDFHPTREKVENRKK